MATLYPWFAARVAAVIKSLERDGFRPRIQAAWRSPAEQLAAVNSGNSGLKVGFHNITAAGGAPEALAVDLLDDDAPLEPSKRYMLRLAAAAQAQGLVTGVRWGLQPAQRAAIDRAIAARDWAAVVKVGWDPLHVEPVGITVAEALQGRRPG